MREKLIELLLQSFCTVGDPFVTLIHTAKELVHGINETLLLDFGCKNLHPFSEGAPVLQRVEN